MIKNCKENLKKATNEEIRTRFDKDVERFSNLETGQQTTIGALLKRVGFRETAILHKSSNFAAFGAIK